VDARIAALARRQHGVVSTAQLRAVGVEQRAVSYRVAAGRLHRLHHGVYAVGHPVLTAHGRWMAAVLAGGAGRC
jgi:predicted transcriptional regulator of viral defense system